VAGAVRRLRHRTTVAARRTAADRRAHRLDLGAKPVIGIVVGIEDPDDEPAYLPDLVSAGWALRVREPGHRCLRAEPAVQRFDGESTLPANLHCYRPSSPEISRYLHLRDRLRADPVARARYANLKRSLATRRWADMNLYADAKGPLIRKLLAEPPEGSAQSPPD